MKKIVLIILFFQIIEICSAQTIGKLVNHLADKNRLEEKYVGFAEESKAYQHFEMLRTKASKKELLNLLKHDSIAVEVYAIYALIDRKLTNPYELFEKYLNQDKFIYQYIGCTEPSLESISSLIYFRYIATRERTKKGFTKDGNLYKYEFEDSKILEKMDSLILHTENPELLMYKRAFYNRIYSKEYQEIIEYWAFDKKEIIALKYVFDNIYKENEEKLESTILEILNKDNASSYEINESNKMLAEIRKKN